MAEPTGRNRPIAVVIDNVGAGLPQFGISEADIIYEILVEGGQTRMLAIYNDISNAGTIGSLRSGRHNAVEIAYSYDAIMIIAGRSFLARDMLASYGIDHINGVEGPHSQIASMRLGRRSPHNHGTNGERVVNFLSDSNFRLLYEEDFRSSLVFTEDGTPENGLPATSIDLRFSTGSKTTSFTYSEANGVYNMRQQNRNYVDGNNNETIGFTNLLILRTSIGADPRDQGSVLREVRTTGRGDGYFVNGGQYIEIVWFRTDSSSQFVYRLPDGSDLELGVGKTYVGFISDTFEPTIS